jgi:endoglucanase
MPAIWEDHFGFVQSTGSAFVIGEWGGPFSGKDQVWMSALSAYLKSKDATDQFFWCLNPNSGDTGGLLADDWATPQTGKLNLLADLVSSPTKFSVNAQGQVCLNGASGPAASASPSSPAQASPSSPAKASASPSSPAKASPSPSSPAMASASPTPASPAQPSASASPAAVQPTQAPAGGFTFLSGSSAWWMAVTIPGSTSVQVDCGNGQGLMPMTAGWASYMWTFSSTNGSPCKSAVQFVVNGGAAQSVTAPW